MGAGLDIETLREVFKDKRTWIRLGQIVGLEPAADMSVLRTKVKIIPDEDEIVARMSWSMTGPDSGIFSFPAVDDLVLICFPEGIEDNAFCFSRLTSASDKIPVRALSGNLVLASLSGKKAHLSSDTKVTVGRGGLVEENEPIPLGNVLKSAISDMMGRVDTLMTDISAGPVGIGNLGIPVPTSPALTAKISATKALLAADIAKYLTVTATNILSAIAYTER